MPTPVQQIPAPRFSYYRKPYPILSFMYGLYCDAEWSTTEFQKWASSLTGDGQHLYEGYLDPYPNLPHPARQLISVTVPAVAEQDAGGRLTPHARLADFMWPYLLQELSFDPALAVSPPDDPNRHVAQLDASRPALSGVALIFLEQLSGAQGPATFAALPDPLKTKLIALANARPGGGDPLEDAIEALKGELVKDFTSAPPPW